MLAEIEAVGVPLLTLKNANFEDEVDVLPISTSGALENGEIAPLFNCHRLAPSEQSVNVGVAPPVRH